MNKLGIPLFTFAAFVGFFACACNSDGKAPVDPHTDAGREVVADSSLLPPVTPERDAADTLGCADGDAFAVTEASCGTLCDAVQTAACTNAPEGAACTGFCTATVSRCPGRVARLLDCMKSNPAFVCDASGNISSANCGAELDCVRACVPARDGG